MGKQSARMWHKGNDHKDIYYEGAFHIAMFKGSQLVWRKLTDGYTFFTPFFSGVPYPYVLDVSSGTMTPASDKKTAPIDVHEGDKILGVFSTYNNSVLMWGSIHNKRTDVFTNDMLFGETLGYPIGASIGETAYMVSGGVVRTFVDSNGRFVIKSKQGYEGDIYETTSYKNYTSLYLESSPFKMPSTKVFYLHSKGLEPNMLIGVDGNGVAWEYPFGSFGDIYPYDSGIDYAIQVGDYVYATVIKQRATETVYYTACFSSSGSMVGQWAYPDNFTISGFCMTNGEMLLSFAYTEIKIGGRMRLVTGTRIETIDFSGTVQAQIKDMTSGASLGTHSFYTADILDFIRMNPIVPLTINDDGIKNTYPNGFCGCNVLNSGVKVRDTSGKDYTLGKQVIMVIPNIRDIRLTIYTSNADYVV